MDENSSGDAAFRARNTPRTSRIFGAGLPALGVLCLLCGCNGDIFGSGGSSGSSSSGNPEITGPTLTLAWDAPTTRADGSPLADLRGYRVYEGSSPGDYTTMTELPFVSEFTVESKSPGTYYFSVTAYDSELNESAFSEELVVDVTASEALLVSETY